MPAVLGVPPEEIRVMAVAIGQRPAARQLGLNENTVKSICYRAGDVKKLESAIQAQVENSLHPNAPKAANALQTVLSERHGKTKLGLSKWSEKAAETLGDLDPADALENHQVAVSVASVMAKVWPEVATDQSTHISFFSISGQFAHDTEEKPVYDVQPASEPSDDPDDY